MSNKKAPKALQTNAAKKAIVAKSGVPAKNLVVAHVGEKASEGKTPEAKVGRKARASGRADSTIKLLQKDNPYREGSKRAASFIAVTKAKTVADYVAKGGKMKYISRWVAAGIISLA